ncbi:hypothetical protein JCM15765_13550 [Paradesulfitobacterium aromaticivorans]
MKKTMWTTIGTLAIAGALAGLGSFSGTALAANSPAPTPPAVAQPAATTGQTVATAAPQANAVTVDTEKSSSKTEQAKTPETDNDNVQYEEQGDHEGNNGVVDKAGAASDKEDGGNEAAEAAEPAETK